jgi:hypothetical protein
MLMRKLFLLSLLIGLGSTQVEGQTGDFCNAISTITRDAPNKFRNIRGKLIDANANATTWACGIKVPGTIGSRFVASMGLFYEGGFLQSKKKEDVRPAYDRCKNLLASCLGPQGYIVSEQPNFYPGMAEYKKLVFMPAVKEDDKTEAAPAHLALEATFNKDIGQYTIVLYIFEH